MGKDEFFITDPHFFTLRISTMIFMLHGRKQLAKIWASPLT